MAGANPQMLIRIAASIDELKRNLAEGKSQIETTTAAMGKLAASLSGDKLIQHAQNITAAVDSIGGVSKLTEAEMARVNATVQKAIEKYEALGREAPAAMVALAKETRKVDDSTTAFATKHAESFRAVGAAATMLLGGIVAVGAGIIELGMRGADVNDVKDAFAGLTKGIGTDATAALTALRTGSQGLISDFDLMKGMNKALGAGFHGTTDDMTLLGAAAHVLADRVGFEGGAASAYTALTDALTTGKGKSLAALGVMVDMKTAAGDLKDALQTQGDAMTSAALAEAGRIEIMKALRSAVADAGDGELDFSEKIDVAKIGVKNFTDDLGSAIAASPALNSALQAIASSMLGAFGVDKQNAIDTIVGYVDKFAIFLVNAAQVAVTGAEYIVGAYRGVQIIFDGVMVVITGLFEAVTKGTALLLEGASKLPGVGKYYTGIAADMRDTATQAEGMRKSFQAQTGEAIKNGGDQMAAFEGVKTTLGTLADTMQKASDKGVVHQDTVKKITIAAGESKQAHSDLEKEIAKLRKTMGDLTDKIELARAKGVNATDMLKLFGDAAVKARLEGQAMGVDVTKAVQDIADAYDKKKLSDLVEKESLKIGPLYEKIMKDAEEKVKKGLEAQNKAYEANGKVISDTLDAHLKLLTQQEGDSLATRLAAVEDDVRKRKGALDTRAMNYKQAMAEIEGYERDATAAVTKAWQDGGYKTMAEHTAEAAHAKLIYETIKHDGQHSAEDIADAYKKMSDAMIAAGTPLVKTYGEIFTQIATQASAALSQGGMQGLKDFGKQTLTDFTSTMLSAIPVVGAALGQLAGPLLDLVGGFFKKIFGTAGRDAVKEFATSLTGSQDLNALHTLLQDQLPASAEKFWIALTQGVGRNNPEQAKKIIDDINLALKDSPAAMAAASYQTVEDLQTIADKAKAVYEYMLASGKYSSAEIAKAFEASKTAQIAAMGETESAQQASLDTISAKYKESLDKLDAEYKSLSQSVGAEAEEAEMGVVEQQQRARLKEIEEERKAQEKKRDDEIAIVQQTFDATIAAAKTADEQVRAIFGRAMKIPIEWAYPDGPPLGGAAPVPMANGGDFMVTRPTLFLAGEAGPERATFSGAHQVNPPSRSSGMSTAAMEHELAEIRRLLRDQPRAMAIATQDAVLLAVRRR